MIKETLSNLLLYTCKTRKANRNIAVTSKKFTLRFNTYVPFGNMRGMHDTLQLVNFK